MTQVNYLKIFLLAEKHWNFNSGVPLYLQGSYYIDKKTAISLGGTFNAISKLGNTTTAKELFFNRYINRL